MKKVITIFLFALLTEIKTAKILCLFMIPHASHSLLFEVITEELLKRGHAVVVVTADPTYVTDTPKNLTEIDIHDISYHSWINGFKNIKGNKAGIRNFLQIVNKVFVKIFQVQCESEAIKNLVKEHDSFDLILYDAVYFAQIAFSHLYKTPVIPINTSVLTPHYVKYLGITDHTRYFIHFFRGKFKELSFLDTIIGFYEYNAMNIFCDKLAEDIDVIFRNALVPESPSIADMFNNINIHLLNVDPIWDGIRPKTSNVFNLGLIHHNPRENISEDLKKYLDSSKDGVIYVSFGTSVVSSNLPPDFVDVLKKVFSQVPYDVLWKWDKDHMPDKPENVKLFKWLPQAHVLKHPKIKLFINQAGLHSIDEAIHAGVPMIGIPILFDQFANAQRQVHHGIGLKLDLMTMTPEKLKSAIETVIGNESYRQNIVKLRTLMEDKPLSSMERAMWAVEYVIRHKGAHHMRSPSANMTWIEFYEIELLSIIFMVFLTVLYIIVKCLRVLKRWLLTVIMNIISQKTVMV